MAFWILLLAAATYLGGVGTGWPLLQHVAYALVLLEVAALIFVHLARRGLTVRSTLETVRVAVGDEVMEEITIQKEGWFPAPWIEIINDNGWVESVGVWGNEECTWTRTRLFPRRGKYSVGSDDIRVRDPFGLFSLAGPRVPHTPVTVYPRAIPSRDAEIAGSAVVGGSRRRQWERDDGSIGELRPYVAGDPPSRVHWRSTARLGTLVVTDEESRRRRTTWLAVDLGGGEEIADRTAGIAAYVAERLWEHGEEIGALIAGNSLEIVPPKRTRDQESRVLEPLAAVGASRQSRLDLLLRSLARCEQRDAVVVISPARYAEADMRRLRRLAPTVRVVHGGES